MISGFSRRIIAIDPGSSYVKILLAENILGKIRILDFRILDLHGEGLLTPEEVNSHLREVIADLDPQAPLALAIPQHQALSHLVDLPRPSGQELRQTIEDETSRLKKLTGGEIVYDYHRLTSYGGTYRNPVWITIAPEQDINSQVERFITSGRMIDEITTPANAALLAYLESAPTENAVLVDLGATATLVTVVQKGVGVYTVTFPIGGESFTEEIVSSAKCSFDEAEALKKNANLFEGEQRLDGFSDVVDAWHENLEGVLDDWRAGFGGSMSETPPVYLSGGGLFQEGFLSYLRKRGKFEFLAWPYDVRSSEYFPIERFCVAYGVVIAAFKSRRQKTSLLTPEFRHAKRRRKQMRTAGASVAVALVLLFVLLVAGCLQKNFLIDRKQNELNQASQALGMIKQIDELFEENARVLDAVHPALAGQNRTLETLKTLQALQQARKERQIWFTLLADSASYFANATNAVERPELAATGGLRDSLGAFIGELCVSEKVSDDNMQVVNKIVNELKSNDAFSKVDMLPPDMRQILVDTNLLVPDGNFALSLVLSNSGIREIFAAAPKATNSPASDKDKDENEGKRNK